MATTRDDINVMLWQRLKELAGDGTLPITGEVYNGDRDLAHVGEDVTVDTTMVTGSGNRKRADVNINVFADDMARSSNVYVSDDARLAELSEPLAAFIESIDSVFPELGLIDYTETKLEEPDLRQHYNNFLIRLNNYDYND